MVMNVKLLRILESRVCIEIKQGKQVYTGGEMLLLNASRDELAKEQNNTSLDK